MSLLSKDTRDRLVIALTDEKAGREVVAAIVELQRSVNLLLEKLDSDAGVSDVDYESLAVKEVKE